ncbi:MAG TPA: glucose 1-dehydrogenase [Candidatus Kapabacteria bacterium]|nr:glucose 1-dehydrogenase [Candidatus Kapabacteria bacterium]
MDYLQTQFGLSGKTALITGASRGLGRAAAQALSSAGATVVLVGRDASALEETKSAMSSEATIVEADVTSASDRERVFASMERVDVLVNNAGIIRRNPVLQYTKEDWDAVISADLTAVFEWSQDAAMRMKESGGGKIINVASILSFFGGINVVAYAAAKGGVAQLTKEMANELAKYNIAVNAIAPGYFNTDATEQLRKNSERMNALLSRIPMGRFGNPEELAGAFVFLASKASDYVTGEIVVVDGGFRVY